MAYGTRVTFDPVRELAFGAFTATLTALGTPLTDNVRLISFSNSTDEDVYVSFDGTTNHLRLVGNSFKLLDLSANKVRDDGLFLAAGIQINIAYESTLGTLGDFWAEVMYAEGGT